MESSSRVQAQPYPWKTVCILILAGTLTGPLVVPYFLGLQASAPNPAQGLPRHAGLDGLIP